MCSHLHTSLCNILCTLLGTALVCIKTEFKRKREEKRKRRKGKRKRKRKRKGKPVPIGPYSHRVHAPEKLLASQGRSPLHFVFFVCDHGHVWRLLEWKNFSNSIWIGSVWLDSSRSLLEPTIFLIVKLFLNF